MIKSTSHAAYAWSSVLRALNECTAWHSVDFLDPMIAPVIRDLWTWPRLCEIARDGLLHWARIDFERAYARLAEYPCIMRSRHLAGQAELTDQYMGVPHREVPTLFAGTGNPLQRSASGDFQCPE